MLLHKHRRLASYVRSNKIRPQLVSMRNAGLGCALSSMSLELVHLFSNSLEAQSTSIRQLGVHLHIDCKDLLRETIS